MEKDRRKEKGNIHVDATYISCKRQVWSECYVSFSLNPLNDVTIQCILDTETNLRLFLTIFSLVIIPVIRHKLDIILDNFS